MQKRGLSSVVTTVLIILISFGAIIVLWKFLLPLFLKGSQFESATDVNSRFSVPLQSISLQGTNVNFNVKRDSGEANITALIISFTDYQGKSNITRFNVTLNAFESKSFSIDYQNLGLANVNKIEVFPVFNTTNGERVSKVGTKLETNLSSSVVVPVCTNECSSSGSAQCSGTGYQTCGNYDSDSCLEWSAVTTCPSGQTCSGGVCSVGCTNECATGARICSGIGYKICGQYDADSCREWSSEISCSSGQVCSNGQCVSSAVCGDGVVEGTEQCDDGNQDNYDDCLNSCVFAYCGDGYAKPGTEQCDDGNNANGDGCSSLCFTESCYYDYTYVNYDCNNYYYQSICEDMTSYGCSWNGADCTGFISTYCSSFDNSVRCGNVGGQCTWGAPQI